MQTEAAEQVEQVAAVEEEAAPVEDAAALDGEEVVEEEEEQDAPLGSVRGGPLQPFSPVIAGSRVQSFHWISHI